MEAARSAHGYIHAAATQVAFSRSWLTCQFCLASPRLAGTSCGNSTSSPTSFVWSALGSRAHAACSRSTRVSPGLRRRGGRAHTQAAASLSGCQACRLALACAAAAVHIHTPIMLLNMYGCMYQYQYTNVHSTHEYVTNV